MKDYGWNWSHFIGSSRGLLLNRRDLTSVDTVLASWVRGRTVAVQAGGNLGIFPKRLAQEFRAVYTFEPDAGCFAALCRNAPEPNILKLQAALGAGPAFVSMAATRRDLKPNPPHEGLTHIDGAGIVPTLRLDDLGLPVCDLIYLDVEGSEAAALAGAHATIDRCRPVIVMEVREEYVAFSGVSLVALRGLVLRQAYRQVGTVLSDEVYIPEVA